MGSEPYSQNLSFFLPRYDRHFGVKLFSMAVVHFLLVPVTWIRHLKVNV